MTRNAPPPLPQADSSPSFFGPSLELGRVAGIPIRVHWTFSLILLWVAFVNFSATASLSGVWLSVLFLLAVFGCVILHELGHSLTALRYGIGTRSITLSPIGGVAALESNPRHWREELWITAAGPAVNAVIALLLLPFVLLTASPALLSEPPLTSFESFLFLLFSANVVLVVFNLLPAFPMDGGRLFRAALTPLTDRRRATEIASRTGQVVAVFMALAGLFLSPMLVLVAAFVFFAASAERKSVEMEEALSGRTVSEVMRDSFVTVSHSHTVDEAIEIAWRNGQNTLPVMFDGRLLGLVHLSDLIRASHAGRGGTRLHPFANRSSASVGPSDELTSAFQAMQRDNREVIPVLSGERLVGLLPQRSVVSLLQLRAA